MKMRHSQDSGGEWIQGRGYRKKVLVCEHELHCPGALVQLVEIGPKTSVPFHYHKTSVEVFHVLDGRGVMTIEGVEYALSPGDTLTCEPPEMHSARNDATATWRYIVFKTNATRDDLYWVEG